MKHQASIFDTYHVDEFRRLCSMLDFKVPFTHLLGPRGVGKSTMVKEAVEGRACAYLDVNLCISVDGLMSSILRSLANLGRKVSGEESSDSDVDMKEDEPPKIKEEMTIVTPEDTPHGSQLVEQTTRGRRKTAVEAVAKLARVARVPKHVNTKPRRPKFDSEFIDDERSTGEVSEEEKSGVGTTQVSRKVFKAIQRAQLLRVRTESAFVQKLELILVQLAEVPSVLVLDGLDWLMDKAAIDSVGPMTKFLDLLSRLSEFVACGNLSILVVSTMPLPGRVSSRTVCIQLPPYTQAECADILARDLRFGEFAKTALVILYPSLCGNFSLLRSTLESIYRENFTEFANPAMLKVKAKQHAAAKLRQMFGGGSSTPDFHEQQLEIFELGQKVRWLSVQAKRVLVAGYLAAHNPAHQDKTIFRKVNETGGKKNRATTTAFKRSRLGADSITVRAPVPFPLHRLQAIFRHISEEEEDGGISFFVSVRELVQVGLFRTSENKDWLRGEHRLNCHAPLDLIGTVADQLNVKLEEVLFA